MKFFRLLKGELDKILMRPILYVITGILVVALVFAFIIYNPAERTDGSITEYDNCQDLTEVYNTFISPTNTHGEIVAQQYITNALSKIENTRNNNSSPALTNLSVQMDLVNEQMINYKLFDTPTITPGENDAPADGEYASYETLKTRFNALKNLYESYINQSSSPILVKTETNNQLNQLFLSTQNLLNSINVSSTHTDHANLRATLDTNGNFNNIENLLNTLTLKTVSETELQQLETNVATAQTYLNTLSTNITTLKDSGDVQNIEELKSLVIRYYLVGLNINELVNTATEYYPVLSMADNTINSYYGYAGTYSYEINEDITYCTFLVENDAVSTDYANVFSATRASNADVNTFDFVYFGLEITSFIIIIFTVVIAAGMLAGEQSNGTLKLLLIRPYSRNKILTSKLLATLIFATIFLIFSTIVLFLIGLFTMGANFTPVLCIFNGLAPFVTSPAVVLLIYLLCLIFKVLMYILLALAISAVFRSNVAAVGISTVLYFLLSIFGTIFAVSYWYGFLPFSNLDLFKYFGGSFIASGNSSPISIIFSSPIFYGGNFLYSALITVGVGLILGICTYWIFKKREIK